MVSGVFLVFGSGIAAFCALSDRAAEAEMVKTIADGSEGALQIDERVGFGGLSQRRAAAH